MIPFDFETFWLLKCFQEIKINNIVTTTPYMDMQIIPIKLLLLFV